MDSDVPKAERAPSAPAPQQQAQPSPTSSPSGQPVLSSSTTSSSNRKRRQPQHPELTSEQQQQQQQQQVDTPSASSPQQALTVVSPQRGSSRDLSTMLRSVSPEEGSSGLRYTKTGRVSRALKGQRVHRCEECGKTYTRKEHLKRHQQNHRPGAFPCDIPGCTRSFNREDLLVRHKQRHNEPPSRRGSFGSSNSAPGEEPPITAPLRLATTASEPPISAVTQAAPTVPITTGQQNDHRRSPRTYLNLNDLKRRQQLPLLNQTPPELYNGDGDDANFSPQYRDELFYEDNTPYLHQLAQYNDDQYDLPRYNGFQYFVAPHPRSPVSASPSSTIAHRRFFPEPQRHSFVSNDYINSFPGGSYSLLIPQEPQFPLRLTHEMAETRDLQECDELATPTTGPQNSHEIDSSLDESTLATEQRYLECYWKQVHPQYPIIFKPIFSLGHTSPLLKAAVLALGGQAQGTRVDIENARILHDRCVRVIKKRTCSNQHTFRVVDMQALFLVELFAIFKARRFPSMFTKSFEDIYSRLTLDEECFQPANVDVNSHDEADRDVMIYTLLRYDREAKQRLLAACYVLENQCAFMFGRTKSGSQHNGSADFIFPRSLAAWDDEERHDVPIMTLSVATHSAIQPLGSDSGHFDGFQSMLLTIYSLESTSLPLGSFSNDLSSLIDQHDWTRMIYHTLMLCMHAPMRDLLAVAGESWLMTEKISSQAEFTQSQLETRNWSFADQQLDYNPDIAIDLEQNIQYAIYHAFEVLKIQSRLQTRTSLVCHEWSVYLAAIVVWARAYTVSLNASSASGERRQSRPRLSIPSSTESITSPTEVGQSASVVLQAGFAAPLSWEEMKNLLLWARHSVYSTSVLHYSGLTNMALDVLGKLATRGNEDGWF